MTATTPQVWLGCLASYNAGRLIGEWVDAIDADEIREAQDRVAAEAVKAAKAAGDYPVYFGDPEEFFIADYDGFGEAASALGEYPSYEKVAEIGALIEQHGDEFRAYLSWLDDIADQASEEHFDQSRRGACDSERDYAMRLVDELGFHGVSPQLYEQGSYGMLDEKNAINVFDELAGVLDWDHIAHEFFDLGAYALVDGYVFQEVQ